MSVPDPNRENPNLNICRDALAMVGHGLTTADCITLCCHYLDVTLLDGEEINPDELKLARAELAHTIKRVHGTEPYGWPDE
jgi:hypothetical protein